MIKSNHLNYNDTTHGLLASNHRRDYFLPFFALIF